MSGFSAPRATDKGVLFVLENCEKTLEIIKEKEEYKRLKNLVIREYYYLKSIKYTGNMHEHFLKYKSGDHKYAKDFEFLEEYGLVPNEKMSDYLEENFPDELEHYWGIEDLIVGNTYTNNEIASTYKCSNMGGMRRSKETNSLILIAKHINPLYDDQWSEDGIFNYTGMGTVGDQSIENGQNKTLVLAKDEGIKVYLFESYKENEYYFDGEVELDGAIWTTKEKDANGELRDVLKFPLKLKSPDKPLLVKEESINYSYDIKEKQIKKISYADLEKMAYNVENKSIMREVITTQRDRDQIVRNFTIDRANGKCDLCGNDAPFLNREGKPYLESHHLITLAEGGPDVIYNTVALCPNCHRKMHIVKDKNDFIKLVRKIESYLDKNNDKVEEEFKNLFLNY